METNNERNEKYTTHNYEELSAECRHAFVISWMLVQQMYYRLTRIDGLRYREAISKIHNDHEDLFSRKQLVRHLSKDDPTVEKRIRTKSPKKSINEHFRARKASTAEYPKLVSIGLISENEIKSTFDALLKMTQAALPDIRNRQDYQLLLDSLYNKIKAFALEQIAERDKAFEQLSRWMMSKQQEFEAEMGINATVREYEMRFAAIEEQLEDQPQQHRPEFIAQ